MPTRAPDVSACITACKKMLVCKGITFNREQCRLKHKMMDKVMIDRIFDKLRDKVKSVRFSCASEKYASENIDESVKEMVIMLMLVTMPGVSIIIVSTMVMRKKRKRTVMRSAFVEVVMEMKHNSSTYENPTFL